jgi:hypothetical protein
MVFVTRRQLGPLLRSHGFPISDSTVIKSTLPSRGTGPKPAGFFGRTKVWDDEVVLEWARANLSPEPKFFYVEKPSNKASEKERPSAATPGRGHDHVYRPPRR